MTSGTLPIPPSLEKVYSLIADTELDLGSVQFIIYLSPEPYMDYFMPREESRAHDRPSYHGRITAIGEKIKLENYEGEWGITVYPDDPDRTAREKAAIKIHNAEVSKILRQNFLGPKLT